jgi:hypothetical protein
MATEDLQAHVTVTTRTLTGASLTTAKACEIHTGRHVPRTHVNEIHHVWPLGHGGPDIPENKKVVCATGHNNVHQLMNLLLDWREKHSGEKFPDEVWRKYTRGEQELALLGVDRIVRQAM